MSSLLSHRRGNFGIRCLLSKEDKWTFLGFSVSHGILKSMIEADEKNLLSLFFAGKIKIPVVNLITEFNTDKENMYKKLKDGCKLSFGMARGHELELNYDSGKLRLYQIFL